MGAELCQQASIRPVLNESHQRMYSSLKYSKSSLTDKDILSLSEKPGFSRQWKMLAQVLQFTPAEIERIRGADCDDAENCYKLLTTWRRKYRDCTVAMLAEAIYNCQDVTILEITHHVLLK